MPSLQRRATSAQQQPTPDQRIDTPRLRLISITPAMLRADQRRQGLEELCGAAVPTAWPPEHWDDHALAYLFERMERYPDATGWCRYIALKQEDTLPVLIGSCGCTEPPETVNDVEIGYSILPEFHRRGYATEAVEAYLPWIFRYPNVRSICAQTYPHLAGSIGVLRKCGFSPDGMGKDPGTDLFRRIRA